MTYYMMIDCVDEIKREKRIEQQPDADFTQLY